MQLTSLEMYANWMTIWSIIYVVVLAILYAYLYDWMEYLEVNCKCVNGLDFRFIKYFPVTSLTIHLAIIIFANTVTVSKDVLIRVFAVTFSLLSIPATIGWFIYIGVFIRFMRRVDATYCNCVFRGQGHELALWTMISQLCHALVSIVFSVLIFVLFRQQYKEYLVEIVDNISHILKVFNFSEKIQNFVSILREKFSSNRV
jgi:hypothetical protein